MPSFIPLKHKQTCNVKQMFLIHWGKCIKGIRESGTHRKWDQIIENYTLYCFIKLYRLTFCKRGQRVAHARLPGSPHKSPFPNFCPAPCTPHGYRGSRPPHCLHFYRASTCPNLVVNCYTNCEARSVNFPQVTGSWIGNRTSHLSGGPSAMLHGTK